MLPAVGETGISHGINDSCRRIMPARNCKQGIASEELQARSYQQEVTSKDLFSSTRWMNISMCAALTKKNASLLCV